MGQVSFITGKQSPIADHKATDTVIDSLDKHIDTYVEIYMGNYGHSKMTSKTNTVKVANLSEKNSSVFITQCIKVLQSTLVKHLKPDDTDLFTLRDEMLGELHQL